MELDTLAPLGLIVPPQGEVKGGQSLAGFAIISPIGVSFHMVIDMSTEVCNQNVVCDVCHSSEHLVAFQTKRVETVHYVNTRTFYWCATCTTKFVMKQIAPKF